MSAPKSKTKISQQYETALLGPAEVTEKRTKTVSRTIVVAPEPETTSISKQAPFTRLTSPKLVKKTVPVEPKPKTVTTKLTTEVTTPVSGLGVEERLKSLGYAVLAGFVTNGKLDAVLAASPLGEKVLIRTQGHPSQRVGGTYFEIEPADDPVIGADVYEFFLRTLITGAKLGARIDTDFAVLTPDGVSIWIDDGTVAQHWLYSERHVGDVANLTGLHEGWFVVASVELDNLKEPATRGNTIVDKLYEPPIDEETDAPVASFSILIQLLRMTGLLEVLRSNGPYTLLAPTNEAFGRLSEGVAEDLVKQSSREKLASILEYHVYADLQDSKQIGDEPTVQGELISWNKNADPITANDAAVLYVDLAASNGIIHIIDRVLIPKQPGPGALTSLPEPVGSDDIDYTTQRIRTARQVYDDRQSLNIADVKSNLDNAIVELARAKSNTRSLISSTLSKTQDYNDIAESPKYSKTAEKLAEDVSLSNDKIDQNLMRENEIQDLVRELETITARIKALSIKLNQTSGAKLD